MWAGLTQIFSPTFTMDITSGVQIWHETSTNQSIGFNPSTTLGLPAYVNQEAPLFPTVNFGNGISQLGPFSGNTEGVTNHGPIGTVAVDLIKSLGKNTVNFGFMGVEQVFGQYNYFSDPLTFDGNFTADRIPWLERRESASPATGWLRRCSASWTVQAWEHRPRPM